MTDATAACSLVVEREMLHPPGKIWRALTQGAFIEEWLMKNDFQPVVGHRSIFAPCPCLAGTAYSTVKFCPSSPISGWFMPGTLPAKRPLTD